MATFSPSKKEAVQSSLRIDTDNYESSNGTTVSSKSFDSPPVVATPFRVSGPSSSNGHGPGHGLVVNTQGNGVTEIPIAGLVPHSPTDGSRSPCSTRLWGKSLNRNIIRTRSTSNPQEKYSLARNVLPHPLPLSWRNKLILGTSSKSRQSVVKQLGWEYRQISPNIDEKALRVKDPFELPLLIATAKAAAVVQQLKDEGFDQETLIITADQIVLYQDEIREKPESEEMATEYLLSYSNHHVSTVSAVVCTYYPHMRQAKDVDVATIHWGSISPSTVKKVIEKGHVYNSAGGFCIEDEDLCPSIKFIDGTVDSVFGLPVDMTVHLMNEVARPLLKDILEEED